MQHEIHTIKGEILRRLLLRERARFSDLKPTDVSSDQFTFHLKRLVEEGVVQKDDDGTYLFTHSGKDYANRFDSDTGPLKVEKQAKLGVLVIPFREVGKKREYIMQQRLKQPFFGFRGFVTGKIKLGETVIDAARRELEEETGMSGSINFKSVYHELIYSKEGVLLEDKYFYICTAENLTGELTAEFEGGRNAWTNEEDILSGDVFYDIEDLLALVQIGAPSFSERAYTVSGY